MNSKQSKAWAITVLSVSMLFAIAALVIALAVYEMVAQYFLLVMPILIVYGLGTYAKISLLGEIVKNQENQEIQDAQDTSKVKCPDCGALVSRDASSCPKCGCPSEVFNK